jgi:hypothetical protein
MSKGKLKSECPSTPVDFDLAIADRVRGAMESAMNDPPQMQIGAPMHVCLPIASLKELLDSWYAMHASLHHFLKYHAADTDAFGRGEYYLGTECVNCEFSRSQQRAVDEHVGLNGAAMEE